MINLMALHWGLINIKINVEGISPATGFIDTDAKDGVLTPSTGRGASKLLAGSGATKRLAGRGGNG